MVLLADFGAWSFRSTGNIRQLLAHRELSLWEMGSGGLRCSEYHFLWRPLVLLELTMKVSLRDGLWTWMLCLPFFRGVLSEHSCCSDT